MPEEPFADLSDRDHVQRMIFTLPINSDLLQDWSGPLERARFLEEVFRDYLDDILMQRHYIVRWPTQVENPSMPTPGFEQWQVEVAVLRRPDEDRH